MIPIAYNLRSLAVRKTNTAAAAGGVALVVFVFSSALMLANGVARALGKTGSPDVAMIVRKGADAELSSGIEDPNVGLVLASEEVARRSGGQPDGVGEVVVVILLDKVGTEGVSNAQIRGVTDDVWAFRPDVRIVAGRRPRPGADEVVIGRAIRGRFEGVDLGQSFELRKNLRMKVVGVFEASGSSFESEVWGDRDTVRSAFGREGVVQSIRVRLKSASRMRAFERSIESNRRLGLEVTSEPEYYEKASEGTGMFLTGLGTLIVVFVSLGAMIGAMITMYAAVSNRRREIGTLRALGFTRLQVLVSFLIESVLLAFGGGVLGALLSLALSTVEISMVNFATWSEIVFRFDPTPAIVLGALVLAVAMGLFGGLLPAVRAARTSVVEAMRG